FGRRIVRVAVAQRLTRRLNDMLWRGEIGLTDLQVNHIAPLRFERPRPTQHLERRLRAQLTHAFGKLHCFYSSLIVERPNPQPHSEHREGGIKSICITLCNSSYLFSQPVRANPGT